MCADLSEDQLEELKEAFNIFDENGDGQISLRELEKIMRSFGMKPSPEELQNMISGIDQTDSGTVDFPEFVEMMRTRIGDSIPHDEIVHTFDLFDRNKDGQINIDELQKGLSSLGEQVSLQEAEQFMRMVDSDGDMKMDFNDFIYMMTHDPE